MQNFTLGKNGTNWFLFAFVLLIGNLSSFGQEVCPTESGTSSSQTFCYLETVGDIQRDGSNTAVYQTDDNQNDTQPIPADELLTDGTTYYVGGESGTCDRVAVTATVNAEATPTNTIFPNSDSFSISPCSATNFSASDLASYFEPISGYSIEVYDSESGTTPYTGELVPGDSYFVGQVGSGCPSTRAAVGYDPNDPDAPTATSPQTFCEGATVADLEAQETYPNTQDIRWYRSETANSPLSDDTQLIDGQTYYASQVVNDRNSVFPPCESEERTAVLVNVEPGPDAGADNTGTVCESDVSETFPSEDAVEDYYLSLLDSGVPANGTFSPSIGQIVSQYQNDEDGLGDFTVTYTIGSGDCQDSTDLTISIIPTVAADAGSDQDLSFCSAEGEQNLYDFLSDDANPDGYFEGYEDGMFNPSEEGTGTYEVSYMVDDSTACVTGSDSATYTIEVTDGAVQNINLEFCSDEFDGMNQFEAVTYIANSVQNFNAEDYDLDGFNPSLETVFAGFDPNNPAGVYETTYSAGTGSCEDVTNFTLTINDPEPANAGDDQNLTFCTGNGEENLYDYLSEDANTNGVFEGYEDGIFDPMAEGAGNYEVTYTVDGSEACVTGSESATFFIEVNEGAANAGGDNTGVVCESDVSTTFPSNDEVRKYYLSLLDDGVSRNGTFDPSIDDIIEVYQADEDGLGDFTVTYTVADGDCTDSAELTVSIIESDPANAGDDQNLTFCTGNGEENLYDYLSEDANPNGQFEGFEDGIFNPMNEGAGSYEVTYTVDESEECVSGSDSATFFIEVNEGAADAGGDNTGVVCESDVAATFPSVDEVRKYYLSLLDEGVSRKGTFTPSISQMVDDYQNDEDGLGDFTLTYTLTDGDCQDSAELTVSIIESQPADAGEIDDLVVCSNEDSIDLYSLLSEDASQDGVFEGYENGMFDPATAGEGSYDITYTVNEEVSCVTGEDSTTFSIEVNEAPNAGADVAQEYCVTEAQEMINSPQDAIDLYYSLLEDGVSQDGTFEPSLEAIATQFAQNPIGTFETVYTVSNDECEDTATISVTINDTVEAEAGDDTDATFCLGQSEQNLYDYLPENANPNGYFEGLDNGMFNPSAAGEFTVTYTVDPTTACVTGSDSSTFTIQVNDLSGLAGSDNSQTVCSADVDMLFPDVPSVRNFYLDMLDEDVATNGTFSPSITEIINAYQANGVGEYNTTYTVGSGECTDSAELNVTILQSPMAGENMDLDVCTNQDTVNLFDFLSVDADTTGEFTLDGDVITDGMMNPSEFDAGTYTVTYTVESDNECTDDMSTFTINVNEVPTSPEAADQSFCAVDMPTGADLMPSGEDYTWYADAEMTTMVAAEDELMTGEYYVTQTNGDCESDAIMINVTIDDIDAPSIDNSALELCEADEPTIADLNEGINESGDITWYDAEVDGEELSLNTQLVDGDTYYASLTSGNTGCESSVRLAVTVELQQCPLVFPEVITPNGDGLNDVYSIDNIENEYPNYNLEVYNRWGNLVYKGNASTPKWDGTSNQGGSLGDDVLPVGVYFWVVEFNDGSTPAKQGKVYLSR